MEIKLICSKCNGHIVEKNNKYICQNCGREKSYPKEERVDMDEETKDYDQVLFE